MCGISGMMAAHRQGLRLRDVARMGEALAHRGPDGMRDYQSGAVAMTHNRLAIIDLTTGEQPLLDADGTALIANGEIYNYRELRRAMPDAAFATQSDCEPPLVLYRREGLGFVDRLRGMWGMAIHDPREGRLVLSRDPFGIKPLYYVEGADGVAFASEPQALLAGGFAARGVDPTALGELLELQFTTRRETIFPGIQRVMPGETIVVSGGRIVDRRRRAALPDGGPVDRDEAAALRELEAALTDSVVVHQRSDVPYGMFLSGGIDSSAVLALMARVNERPVRALTAYFPDAPARDERGAARKAAEACGAELTDVAVEARDFFASLPAIAAAMDDPAADYAIVPTWHLAKAARAAGLKVVLSGEGGDELFGGYGRYRAVMRPWWLGGRAMRRRGNLQTLDILREPSRGWRDGVEAADVAARTDGRTRLQVAQALDSADWLSNDLLAKLDRCLMAHGIEGRTPFLDPVVADAAFRLPDGLKIRNGLGKWILRRWLAGALPASEPMARKRGFTVPVATWILAEGARLGPLVARQPGIAEIARPGTIERLFTRGGKREGFAAWTLLFYALWHRRHVLGLGADGDVFDCLASTPAG
ncbi:MAG: asparagine synthase (glutamine-hydrolyzing) [Phreatobacter sp.]|uniref:asparagine synthase (glutamine-hydrolyzing) n=1 Tax=Phreatobacter sp. TaxID=1966341 RepID=UPI001A4F5DD9|nr:asparagine synthase (glutamine-hydrolyzing) [Phreatobacter sp.]MBL8571878.1 asparagine synthase (glutamine-hydrolyzing) [Phreatobacter sp.]